MKYKSKKRVKNKYTSSYEFKNIKQKLFLEDSNGTMSYID